jgi:GNAT superfamily N-acetyltransferase
MGMLDRAGFLAEVNELTAVYGAAMLAPREHLAGRRSMMERHTYHPRFRAVLVRPDGAPAGPGSVPAGPSTGPGGVPAGPSTGPGGVPAGPGDMAAGPGGVPATAGAESGGIRVAAFSYGFHGAAGQWWHDVVQAGLTAAAGRRATEHWLADSFEIAEVHVRPEYQRRGIGRAMLLRLTAGADQRTALLSTQDLPSPARHLYRSLGFTDLLTGFCFPGGGPPYAVMGAELPLAASGPRLFPPSPSRW